jgi:hypothetical protein
MAERDPEFAQDVLRILYAALADREALAAAMSGQQPMPVPNAAPGQPGGRGRRARSGSSPMEVGVQGGAPPPIPPPKPLYCADLVAFEHLAFDQTTEGQLLDIQKATGASREQEALRRALKDKIAEINGLIQ